MFLERLLITNGSKTIRDVRFRKGLNLIVDTSAIDITGNNVGKTTVLKLIDFCFGGRANPIWVDPENQKNEYLLIKNFLKENPILVTLVLKENLDVPGSRRVIIERNFTSKKNDIKRDINGVFYLDEDFETGLAASIFPGLELDKPTFRQIISHNFRYKDESINNTLRTLDRFTRDDEYESLHLFMLGIDFVSGSEKQFITAKLKQEETFKTRLEKTQTRTAYEVMLGIIDSDIESLNKQKSSFNLNLNFEEDLNKLTSIRYRINVLSSEISNLEIRKNLIIEASSDLENGRSDLDIKQLKILYLQASNQIEGIQKTFEDLVDFHNQMITEKVSYITKELPSLEKSIGEKQYQLNWLLQEERDLTNEISKSDSFEELEKIIAQLNEKFRKKGEYENTIESLKLVESEIETLNSQLQKIESDLFSEAFEQSVLTQINKFNRYFSAVSLELYGEQYALKHDIVTNKAGRKLYKFSAFNTNFSSGKKQGEISCFDIAYTIFADNEGIPCMHFILNDKKELMHDNQLVKIKNLVESTNIQFVAAILRDKLPAELDDPKYFVLELSQSDKLFRIKD